MTAPNRNALWGRILVDELAKNGVTAACIAPGSRSTPLTVAFAEHDGVEVFSHLDERSAAFFALGRAKHTGTPTPLVCTSGTATANFHPAVIEADHSRVSMLLLTADRPPELHDSGVNQTIDQERLYGDAVRWYRTLPEPEANARKLRGLRTTVARAVARSTGASPGPVHLNVPFRKPLEPTDVAGDVPDGFERDHPEAVRGRDGPFVRTTAGRPTLDTEALRTVTAAFESAERRLIVAGPMTPFGAIDAIGDLARVTDTPVFADPLSGIRFGRHVEQGVICGGYDSYLTDMVTDDWETPDVVLRFGASPTSQRLQHYLARTDSRQFLVDPAGGWREATFTATDHIECDPTWLAEEMGARLDETRTGWAEHLTRTEDRYWSILERERESEPLFEGAVLGDVVDHAPDPAMVFVSNSMPVRDLDRFGRPRTTDLTVLGNRGASGIDGITSTALGAGSTADEPLVLVIGDLAYYHDMNGLLAVERCGVDATIVLINNDGGGIFHKLPIEDFDPPFTEQFKTPHGLDFEPTGDLYGFDFDRVNDLEAFREAYRRSLDIEGTQVIEVEVDAEPSHRIRERLHTRVCRALAG